MISRRAFDAHICWKFHLLLSKSLLTAQFLVPHFSHARLQHNDAFRDGSKTPEAVTQGAERPTDDDDSSTAWDRRKPKYAKHIKVWRPLWKKTVTERPLGRLHGFRGHKLREKRVKVDVDSLGAPSEVIVLRDAGFLSNPLPAMEDLEMPQKVDILAQVQAERGIVTQADVEKNIEHFRPKTNTISWDELQQIQQQLVSGFTISQLVNYIDSREHRPEKVEKQRQAGVQEGSAGAEIRQTLWMPQISEPGASFEESHLRGYDSEAFTHKQRLVLLLLRQCWQLETQEIIDSIGELQIEIPQRELELLIGGRNPLLKVISNSFITTQDEKIEVFLSGGVIRITSSKEKSELIAREIRNMLGSIRSLIIDLDALISTPQLPKTHLGGSVKDAYDEILMSELARLTETHITRLPSNQISVSCIHTQPQVQLSTKADVARRLLLTSSDLANHTKTLHICNNTLKPLYAVKYHMKNGMPWRDRLRNWVRWTSPTLKPLEHHDRSSMTPVQIAPNNSGSMDEVKMENSCFAASRELPVFTNLSEEDNDQSTLQKNSTLSGHTCWETNGFTETSAVIGHVLFEAPVTSEISEIVAGDSPAYRTKFHHGPVNISRLLGTISSLDNSPTSSLVLRFVPSPWTSAGPQALVSLPPIEMRFAVDPNTKDLQLKDVIAEVESTASDVMLPDRIVDIRFQQRTMSRLRSLDLSQLPQISEFLKISRLNLTHGRLETPPGLNLPIEPHICAAQMPETPENFKGKLFNAEYIFGGLEYRSTLALNFRGWQLFYTSVEGGKADGRRGELSLMPQRMKGDMMNVNKSLSDLTEEYVQAAYFLVDTLANQNNIQAGERHSSMKLEGTKILNERSHKKNLESKKTTFNYFRKSIDFTNLATQKEEFDEE